MSLRRASGRRKRSIWASKKRRLAARCSGSVSPSGRLPFTIPIRENQLPPFEPRATRVHYDLWHGYRRLQQHLGEGGEAAAYPFGFGLSYCSFSLTEIAATIKPDSMAAEGSVELSLCVGNGGSMEAAEVVQVYLEPPGELLERPRRTLAAFKRLTLPAHGQRRLTLTIPMRQLACFDPERDAFVLEAGVHRLVVARHAEDPGLAVDVELQEAVLGP